MTVNLADAHLTYIEAASRQTTYDVYPRGGGLQLGQVMRSASGKTWIAVSFDPHVRDAVKRTRWEATTALWGAWPDANAFTTRQKP